MSTRESYDAVAERYAAELGDELAGKPLDRALLDLVLELADGGLVADLGAGPGHVAGWLTAQGGRVVALDLSPQMCRLAPVPAVAGDLTALPLADGVLEGAVALYCVIHLDGDQRAAAYRELARVLAPGGHALISFHVSDAEHESGASTKLTEWWGSPVDVEFRFLDPDLESAALVAAGLVVAARAEREPYDGIEHASRRAYLLVRRQTCGRSVGAMVDARTISDVLHAWLVRSD